jgi:hypothetical protein
MGSVFPCAYVIELQITTPSRARKPRILHLPFQVLLSRSIALEAVDDESPYHSLRAAIHYEVYFHA